MKNLKTWECSLRKSSVYLHLLPPKWPFGGWFWNVAHLNLLTIYRLNFLSKKSLSFGLTTSTIKPKRFPLFNASSLLRIRSMIIFSSNECRMRAILTNGSVPLIFSFKDFRKNLTCLLRYIIPIVWFRSSQDENKCCEIRRHIHFERLWKF